MPENRLSYVREMRRNRARRIAIARLAAARTRITSDTNTTTTTDTPTGRASTPATANIDHGRRVAQPRKPLIYLGRHSHSRRNAIRLTYFLSTYVYRGLWVATVGLGTALAGTSAAQAAGLGTSVDLPKDTLTPVIEQLRLWLVIVLAAVATLFFVLGALRYLASNGDPGEIERAKSALKSSAIGYALALTAPLFIGVVTALFPAQK